MIIGTLFMQHPFWNLIFLSQKKKYGIVTTEKLNSGLHPCHWKILPLLTSNSSLSIRFSHIKKKKLEIPIFHFFVQVRQFKQ